MSEQVESPTIPFGKLGLQEKGVPVYRILGLMTHVFVTTLARVDEEVVAYAARASDPSFTPSEADWDTLDELTQDSRILRRLIDGTVMLMEDAAR